MTHKALFEINRDQDDLLAKLKKKEQALEKQSLRVSNIFSDFKNGFESQQEFTNDEYTLKRITNAIAQEGQSMY